MKTRPRRFATLFGSIAAGALALALAQDGEAPPAIAQDGIANFASHMPAQLAGGGIAPGSLIRIRGWRLGPAPRGQVAIRIHRGDTRVETTALSIAENEVVAQVPQNAPLGSGMLQVVKSGQASLEWPVTLVEASFGAASRNGQGWGPGEIANSAGVPNSADHPAKPGESAVISGTGLGARIPARVLPQVLVAGHLAKAVRVLPRSAGRPGIDTVAFTLPADTPEGCQVPVQVSSAPGVYSNAVTMAVSGDGKPCHDRTSWLTALGSQPAHLATVALFHGDLEIALTGNDSTQNPIDAGLAAFAEIDSNSSVNRLFLFPPAGTCTSYAGTAGLHAITSPLSALEALPGKPLDAGPNVTISGHGSQQVLPPHTPSGGTYSRVIGGHAPIPGMREMPLFLTPGDYTVSAAGGAGVGAFETSVRVGSPIEWQNREQLTDVDRARGATLVWHSSMAEKSIVVIIAMNEDSRSGAFGMSACLASASDGTFRIPPYALANIPPTAAHPRGFPLNLVVLLELPEVHVLVAKAQGLDRVLAFAASASARTVRFK